MSKHECLFSVFSLCFSSWSLLGCEFVENGYEKNLNLDLDIGLTIERLCYRFG